MNDTTTLRPLLDRTLPELREEMAALGLDPWRADQVFAWVYKKGVADFPAMTDIGRSLQGTLAGHYRIDTLTPKDERTAADAAA